MITFFATARPFKGKFDMIQRNAISSWKYAVPGAEVIILGKESGVAEVCREYGAVHIPDVEYDALSGQPFVSSLFRKARAAAKYDILCFLNCDNIVLDGIGAQVDKVRSRMKQFVIVGYRSELEISGLLDLSDTATANKLREEMKTSGQRMNGWWIDYFVFTKNAFVEVPPFIVGAGRWDNWMIERTICSGLPLIDATETVAVIHQKHDDPDYLKYKFNSAKSSLPGLAYNSRLYDSTRTALGYRIDKIDYATYRFSKDGRLAPVLWNQRLVVMAAVAHRYPRVFFFMDRVKKSLGAVIRTKDMFVENIRKYFRQLLLFIRVLRDVVFTRIGWRFKTMSRLDGKIARAAVGASIRHIYGRKTVRLGPEGLVVVCMVRDGAAYVGEFIEYYLGMGAGHIVFLDNNSTDGTLARIERSERISILQCALPYKTYEWGMKRYLLDRFGSGHWCLVADIDEFMDYPYSGSIGLDMFLKYLNSREFNVVVTHMLDMFPADGDKAVNTAGGIRARNRLCDLSGVAEVDWEEVTNKAGSRYNAVKLNRSGIRLSDPGIKFHQNGVKKSAFGVKAPWTTKTLLVFKDRGINPDDCTDHLVRKGAYAADVSAVLYHYKFSDGFFETLKKAVDVKNAALSQQYFMWHRDEYIAAMSGTEFDIKDRLPGSEEISGVDDLVAKGFLRASDGYRSLIQEKEGILTCAQDQL